MPLTHPLPLHPATRETLAPFGRLLAPGLARPNPSAYYGAAVAPYPAFPLDVDSTLEAWPVRLQPRPLRAAWLERHPLHGQAFIPLGARPFVMILGPPGEELPAPAAMAALRFDGTAAVALHRNTWHEVPLALELDTDLLILTRRDTMRDLARRVGNEASGPDLDKRDLEARLGLIYEAVWTPPPPA